MKSLDPLTILFDRLFKRLGNRHQFGTVALVPVVLSVRMPKKVSVDWASVVEEDCSSGETSALGWFRTEDPWDWLEFALERRAR